MEQGVFSKTRNSPVKQELIDKFNLAGNELEGILLFKREFKKPSGISKKKALDKFLTMAIEKYGRNVTFNSLGITLTMYHSGKIGRLTLNYWEGVMKGTSKNTTYKETSFNDSCTYCGGVKVNNKCPECDK